MSTQADTIDLADILRTLRRGWREVIGFILLGTLGALAVVLWAPKRFDSSATLLVRQSNPGASLLSRLGLPGDAGSLIPGGGGATSSQETELQILQSRSLLTKVIDSLGLQARILEPAQHANTTILSQISLPGSFKSRKYEFTRTADRTYLAKGPGDSVIATVGTPVKLAVGTVTLRADTALPPQFKLALLDHEDAVLYAQKHLRVEKAGGDVIRILYQAGDSMTAPRVANALAADYLAQRKVNDRGTNTHRVEFLEARSDSVSAELAIAEDALRRQQESSGVLDPITVGKAEIERAGELRGQLTEIDVERGAIDQLLTQVGQGTMSDRQLAAFPTFIKSPAISQMLGQLTTLEADRQKLLATRTEADPDVIAAEQSIKTIDGQLLPIARSYAASLDKERNSMQAALDTLRTATSTLPKNAEAAARLQRDVLRLGQIYGALQTQLVAARLSAIDEGGDARQLDVALPSKKPAFPEPITTMGLGVSGGLVAGLIAALLLSGMSRWARDPLEIERMSGVPSLRFDAAAPLFLSGAREARTLLVVPLEARASVSAVARRLADTATARSISATILDLSGRAMPSMNGRTPPALTTPSEHFDVNGAITRLESEYGLVIVQLPDLASDVTAAALSENRPAVLVAPVGRVDRVRLANTLQTLRRLDVPCAGIVLSDGARDGVLTT